MKQIAAFAFIIALTISLASAANPATTQPLAQFKLPEGWTQRLEGDRILIDAPGRGAIRMQIHPMELPGGKPLDDDTLNFVVKKLMDKAKLLSLEENMPLTAVDGKFSGKYFTCTSKKAKGPPEHQFVSTIVFTQGQGLTVTTSITHRRDDEMLKTALEIIENGESKVPQTK